MARELLIGIAQKGTIHTDADPPISVDEMFRRVKESGAYDYFDKTPPDEELAAYQAARDKYELPIVAGGWFYQLGQDEALLTHNLQKAQLLGSRVHNVQVLAAHAGGHAVTNEEVADFYLHAYETGERLGVAPCFEVHVNMWSEDFRRVAEVAALVERRGATYRMTLDHSHVIFKIDNPAVWDDFRAPDAADRARYSIRAAMEAGTLVLHPAQPGNVTQQWIDAGWVRHMHARAAVPNGPPNVWMKNEQGQPGRGIQYPFIAPAPGEWHSPWDESRLEPWKAVVRNVLRHRVQHDDDPLHQISTEFIPNPDYGGGAKYSIFNNSVACAQWIRATWNEMVQEAAA